MKENDTRKNRIKRRLFLETSGKAAALGLLGSLTPRSGKTFGTNGPFDILIKRGSIFDGKAAEPYVADIGIVRDKITAIGKLSDNAGKTIDARGLMVTPGFIDVHTHCDMSFTRVGKARVLAHAIPSWKGNYNYLYQGVTTVVSGNCGYGYADTDAWMELIDKLDFGTNVCHLAPHGVIREELFGNDQPRELSKAQLQALKDRVAQELDKGAVGLSTGLEYAPGLLSTTDELVELCKVVEKRGGVYATHVRDLSAVIYPDGRPGVVHAIEEAIQTAERSGVSLQISHLIIKEPLNGTKAPQVLEPIEAARNRGLDVLADQHPYAAGSTMLTDVLPTKFKGLTSVKDEYKTKAGRAEIKSAIREVFEYLGPDRMLISLFPANITLHGKTVKQVADQRRQDPADTYTDLVCSKIAPVMIFFFLDIDTVREIMKNDFILTASDGMTIFKGVGRPHPRIYGTFTHKLDKFVIEEKIISLQAAIRSMTSLPAEKFKLKGRGVIEENGFADINIIDLDNLQDRATYQNPDRYPIGIVHQLVNGVASIKNNKVTGKSGARGLRRT